MPDRKVYVQHARKENYHEWVQAMGESFDPQIVEVMERYVHSVLFHPEDRYKTTKYIGKAIDTADD